MGAARTIAWSLADQTARLAGGLVGGLRGSSILAFGFGKMVLATCTPEGRTAFWRGTPATDDKSKTAEQVLVKRAIGQQEVGANQPARPLQALEQHGRQGKISAFVPKDSRSREEVKKDGKEKKMQRSTGMSREPFALLQDRAHPVVPSLTGDLRKKGDLHELNEKRKTAQVTDQQRNARVQKNRELLAAARARLQAQREAQRKKGEEAEARRKKEEKAEKMQGAIEERLKHFWMPYSETLYFLELYFPPMPSLLDTSDGPSRAIRSAKAVRSLLPAFNELAEKSLPQE